LTGIASEVYTALAFFKGSNQSNHSL